MSNQPQQERDEEHLSESDAIPLTYHDNNSPDNIVVVSTTSSNLDPTKSKAIINQNEMEPCYSGVTTRRGSAGHTFLVGTIANEESVITRACSTSTEVTEEQIVTTTTSTTTTMTEKKQNTSDNLPSCSINCTIPEYLVTPNKAIVPLSSSLPSKLLRLHAKCSSSQTVMEQVESMDSQFGSEDGAAGGALELCRNECAEIYDIPSPTTELSISTPPPRTSPIDGIDDGGVGSSIEDSEVSEVDDELKPLAVDNHVVLHDNEKSATPPNLPEDAAVLSEANLEKFRKHHHHHHHHYQNLNVLENIYLHPNFKYELQAKNDASSPNASPPPAVAPANSPTEQPKRVHRSFLTMAKKPTLPTEHMESERASSVTSNPTSVTTTELHGDQPLINEIDSLDPALIPSDELAAEITEAVEFYFSNESILKDAFLLKHVRRNKEGYVSLKLVSSFKRVRQLTKEWKVVGNALQRKSRKIELNDVGTKVRRLETLPSFDETMPSRTIVACDLPFEKLTIEKVSDIFSKCGEIALIRILKPGMAIPVDVRQFMNKYPEMQQKECALVEYLESSAAREAKHLPGLFQVFDMVAPKKKTGKKAAIIQVTAPVTRMVENYRYYNDASYERTRGGSFSGVVQHENDLRFKLRRNNSDFHTRPLPEYQRQISSNHNIHHYQPQPHPMMHQTVHRSSLGGSGEHIHHPHQQYQQQQQQQHQQPQYHFQPRPSLVGHEQIAPGITSSPGGNTSMNFYAYSPRRYSNASTLATGQNDGQSSQMESNNSHIVHNVINNNNNNNSNHNVANISPIQRRLSNCSDTYSSYSEMSRRHSNCSETNVPPSAPPLQRRDSNCSENCPCGRRVSELGQNEVYRKISQSSIGSGGERRFSNGSMQFERTFSNASDYNRRISNDYNNSNSNNSNNNNNNNNTDRKHSIETQSGGGQPYNDDGNVGGGGGGYNVFRRYSNNFNNNVSNKLAQYDNAQYINGRRISSDSGYDRRCSFGSEYENSPRSRTSSFLNSYNKHGGIEFGDGSPRSRTNSFLDGTSRSRSGSFAMRNSENLVRTPLGPDGSKGFGARARKFGNTISPVN